MKEEYISSSLKPSRRVCFITCGDYFFAGSNAIKLRERGYRIDIVDKEQKRSTIKNKIALALAMNFGAIAYGVLNFIYKFRIRKHLVTIASEAEIINKYNNEKDTVFILFNYDSKIQSQTLLNKKNFLNFHPSLLPMNKGLGPIFWEYYRACVDPNYFPLYGWSLHTLNDEFDGGSICYQAQVNPNKNTLWDAYKSVYINDEFIAVIERHCARKPIQKTMKKYPHSRNKAPNLKDALFLLSIQKDTIGQFLRFFINGGVMGLLSWALQLIIFNTLMKLHIPATHAIYLSILTSFLFILLVNFVSQKNFVFKQNGNFFKFAFISFLAISAVSLVASALMVYLQEKVILHWLIYPFSALALSPIVFLLKKRCVFNQR